MDEGRGREVKRVFAILLTIALSFDSIFDGTFTNACLFLENALKAQEECDYDSIDVRKNTRSVETEGAAAAD